MKYIAYWIPTTWTIKHSCIESKKEKDISDNEGCIEILKLHLYTTCKLQYNDSVELTCVSQDECGMFIYRFDGNIDKRFQDILKVQGYHLFKSIFHQHIAHDDEQDALLIAKIYDTQPTVEEASLDYLMQYDEKFQEYFENLYAISSPKQIVDEYKKSKKGAQNAIERIIQAQHTTQKVFYELSYAQYLSNENFNKKFSAHKEKFEILYKEYEVADDLIDISYATIMNRIQIMLAIFLFIIGIIYPLINGMTPEEKNQHTIIKLIKQNSENIKKNQLLIMGKNPKTLFPKEN